MTMKKSITRVAGFKAAAKQPKTLTITKQDFRNFCKAAVEGLRVQHAGKDYENEMYWLCVALCEATSNTHIGTPFAEWADVTAKLHKRETGD